MVGRSLAFLVLFMVASVHGADFAGKNVVVFMTDQERHVMNFPPGWEEQNLPNLQRLKKNGVTFKNAFTNACMCSPARTTLLTGFMPAQHGVRYTLEQAMVPETYPQVEMPKQITNLAKVFKSAGYDTVYKGKFHTTKPLDKKTWTWRPIDVGQYGWTRWNCPDSGANQSLGEAGGPTAYNDARYMNNTGAADQCQEGILDYINNAAPADKPFFLVASLVNPHDVLFYPKNFNNSYNDPSLLVGDIKLPPTVNENITYPNKPSVQYNFYKVFELSGALTTTQDKLNYLNFYGNLMKMQDNYLGQVMDALEARGMLDNTVIIRTSDHGEMGLSHHGLRQKNFNFYEQSLRVPLVYSNPQLFPTNYTSQHLVSHVDFAPTLASLVGGTKDSKWAGVDYSSLVMNPDGPAVQDYIMFTYDDYQAGQSQGPYVKQPNHIVAIRETRYKLAKYYDPIETVTKVKAQHEMYDLQADPNEKNNLARPGYKRTPVQEQEYQRLKKKLDSVRKNRLAPLPLERVIKLNANTTEKSSSGNTVYDTGSVSGVPTGKAKIALSLTLYPIRKEASYSFQLTSDVGLIRGVASAKYTISGNNISLAGKANFTWGNGAFRGIKAYNLAFTETDTLDGQNGKITFTGKGYW